jgi:hypothetical protein
LASIVVGAAAPLAHAATTRDDTAWLQAKLDAGGNVFLPKLSNGQCYETRGLWVSRDDTTIASDGACIVALGPGEARLKTASGKPIPATSIFRIDHSNILKPLPARVAISGLELRVPASKRMDGIDVYGGEISLDHLTISGSPVRDVVIGGGEAGAAGITERIVIRGCNLTGGQRDIVSIAGPLALRVEDNTLAGARRPDAAGLRIRSADRGQAVLDTRISGNMIRGNAGPGLVVDLDPKDGAPILADGIEISSNQILRNARKAPPAVRAGVVLAGGQDDGQGRLVFTNNLVHENRGPAILGRNVRFALSASGNDLARNSGGAIRGLAVVSKPLPRAEKPWIPSATRLTNTQGRDDTAWLQARLDARGGTVFLPKLPNGECYATHGLWVSHDDTTITSDGACIVSLGPGAGRLRSGDGDVIPSEAVFYISRSNPKKPSPLHVTISNLRIIVPPSQEMYGIAVYAHDVTLSGLDISGSPKDDVIIGGRGNANGYAAHVALRNSTLDGAKRNAITVSSAIDVGIEGNTIEGVRDLPPGQPAAGIDVEPDDRGQPILDVRILNNTIQDNAGPGILLPLETNSGPTLIATGIEITGNTILRNANKRTPPTRAGIAITGGEDGGQGTLDLTSNVIRDNGGPGILLQLLKLVVHENGNQLSGNEDG